MSKKTAVKTTKPSKTAKPKSTKAPSNKAKDLAPNKTEVKPTSAVNKKAQIIITAQMETAVKECAHLVNCGAAKSEAAREAVDMLKDHTRQQIIYVFINGCKLTKAGSGTYYQNLVKNKHK